MGSITEQTKLSIAIVVTLIGGALWLSKIYFMAEAAAISVEKVSLKQDQYNSDISQIKTDIAVIKARIVDEEDEQER